MAVSDYVTEVLDELIPVFDEIRQNSSNSDDLDVADNAIDSIRRIKQELKTGNLSVARKEWFKTYKDVTESYVWHADLTDKLNSIVKKLRNCNFMDF